MSQLTANTLGPTYNMFGFKVHPLTRSSFFWIFLVFDCTGVVPPFTSLADSYNQLQNVPFSVTEVTGVVTSAQSKICLVVPTDVLNNSPNNEMSYSSSICRRCSVSAEKVGVRTFMPGPDLSSVGTVWLSRLRNFSGQFVFFNCWWILLKQRENNALKTTKCKWDLMNLEQVLAFILLSNYI